MAIKLVETGFSIIPKVFIFSRLSKLNIKKDFGKMIITLATKKGMKQIERYNLVKSNGEANEGAMKAFSFFAKTALNDFHLMKSMRTI